MPVARHHGERRAGRAWRAGPVAVAVPEARGARGHLQAHVGDVEPRDRRGAVEQPGGELGIVGVDVDLERVAVADHEHRVADRLELRDPRRRVEVVAR